MHWYQPSAERLVVRSRLLERLDEPHPVTLVRAPAGFGKRTMVRLWAETRAHTDESATVWVPVQDQDRTAGAFWGRLVAALEQGDHPRPRRGTEAAARSLLGRLERPATLVVDRLDRVADGDLVARLLELVASPAGHRLVVTARTPLAALSGSDDDDPLAVLAGQARVVEGQELLMTTEEAGDLFVAMGIDRSADQVEALRHQAGGWPVLLREVALAIGGSSDRVDDAEVADRVVRDHVGRRLLPDLRPDDVDVLTTLAVPRRLTAGSAAALLDQPEGVAARLLGRLERCGAVTTRIDDGERLFEWPAAVSAALRELTAGADPDQVRRHDRVLSRWHLGRGECAPALEHADAAGDGALAGEVLDRYWLPLLVYHNDVLADAFRRAAPEWFAGRDWLRGVRDLTLRLPGDHAAGAFDLPHEPAAQQRQAEAPDVRAVLNRGLVELFGLRRARRLPEALDLAVRMRDVALAARVASPGAVSDLLAPIFLLTAAILEVAGDFAGAIAPLRWCCETADQSVLRGNARHGSSHLAMDLALLGEDEESEEWLVRAAATPVVAGWVAPRARIATLVAEVLLGTNRLDHERARRALRRLLVHSDPLDEMWPMVLYARAQYALVWGDRLAVVQQILRERASRPDWAAEGSDLDALLRAAEVDLLLALGQRQQASRAVQGVAADQPLLAAPRARLALLSGQPEVAVAQVHECLLSVPAPRRAREDLVLIEAVAQHRLGHHAAAADLLDRAMRETPAPSLRAVAMVPRADLQALAERVPAAAEVLRCLEDRRLGDVFPASLEPVRLTQREQVILRHLAAGLARDVIARRLSVSSHTVKSQTHSIYRKLGVRSRAQALVAAHEHGLLTRHTKDENRG